MWNFPAFPEQASSLARRIDSVYFPSSGSPSSSRSDSCSLSCSPSNIGADRKHRSNAITHSLKLEIFWVTIPSLISLGLFFWAATLFFHQFSHRQTPRRSTSSASSGCGSSSIPMAAERSTSCMCR